MQILECTPIDDGMQAKIYGNATTTREPHVMIESAHPGRVWKRPSWGSMTGTIQNRNLDGCLGDRTESIASATEKRQVLASDITGTDNFPFAAPIRGELGNEAV